jgi:uncharacterized integral membrane protein
MIMPALSFLIRLIILVAAVFFSMANTDTVGVGIWPLEERIDMPLFLPILTAIALGFLLGWIRAWIKFGRTRQELRKARRELRDADLEVGRLKDKLKSQQHQILPAIDPNSN